MLGSSTGWKRIKYKISSYLRHGVIFTRCVLSIQLIEFYHNYGINYVSSCISYIVNTQIFNLIYLAFTLIEERSSIKFKRKFNHAVLATGGISLHFFGVNTGQTSLPCQSSRCLGTCSNSVLRASCGFDFRKVSYTI